MTSLYSSSTQYRVTAAWSGLRDPSLPLPILSSHEVPIRYLLVDPAISARFGRGRVLEVSARRVATLVTLHAISAWNG